MTIWQFVLSLVGVSITSGILIVSILNMQNNHFDKRIEDTRVIIRAEILPAINKLDNRLTELIEVHDSKHGKNCSNQTLIKSITPII